MMARRYSRTYRSAAQAHAKVTAARQELLSAAAAPMEEPMHRYPHPIPLASSIGETAPSARSLGEIAVRSERMPPPSSTPRQ